MTFKGLTIKQKGHTHFGMSDKEIDFSIGGKQIMNVQSVQIDMDCKEPTKAYLTLLDIDVDFENISYKISIKELEARKLLRELFNDPHTKLPVKIYDKVEKMVKQVEKAAHREGYKWK